MSDWSWVAPVAAGIGKGVSSAVSAGQANSQMQAAYDEMLRNLKERFADYDKLGSAGYKDIIPQELAASAFATIPDDPVARQKQQEALAALGELAKNGGLSLGDMKALNDIQGNLNRNNTARRLGLKNDFAARGQLGAGAELAMDLAGQQQAAQTANQAGESAAAQAQARALDAVLKQGSMARQMGNDEYNRNADAARAADMIAARNAAARTDASKYNNSMAAQAYQDELAKARGKTSLTNSINDATFGQGKQSANTTLGYGSAANSAIDAVGSGWGKMAGSSDTGGGATHDASGGGGADHSGGGDSSDPLADAGDYPIDDEDTGTA